MNTFLDRHNMAFVKQNKKTDVETMHPYYHKHQLKYYYKSQGPTIKNKKRQKAFGLGMNPNQKIQKASL